jgi:1-acyl-sn-glycerol-3-phosphate acyltransferase
MFKALYNHFGKHIFHLIIPVFAVFGIALYLAFTIEPVEEISEMLPMDESTERFDNVRKNIRFNDRIILIISNKDSATTPNTKQLIAFADSLHTNILSNYDEYIDNEQNAHLSNIEGKVYDIFYRHLPIFLTKGDYEAIDSLMSPEAFEKVLEQNFKNLISPAGSFTQKYIRQDPLSITPKALKRLEKLKPDESFSLDEGYVFTENKRHLLLFIDIKHSENTAAKSAKLIKGIREQIEKAEKKQSEIQVEMFGAPVVAAGNSEQIKTDILFTVSLAVIVLIIFLTLFFRRAEIFLIIFLPAVFGAAVSVAIIHLIQGNVSLISLGIGSVLTGISIDYSLHLLNHARLKKQAGSLFKDISAPILISSLSTATAFFALLFVSSKALQDLGLFAGISVLSAAIFALVVLPHLIRKSSGIKTSKKITERIAAFPFHKSKTALIILATLTLIGSFFAGKTQFEGDMDRMNYMSPETQSAQNTLNEISGLGYKTLYIAAQGQTLDEALNANRQTGSILDSLLSEQIIESYTSVHPVLIAPELQKERISRWNDYFSEEKKNFIKENLKEQGKKFGFKTKAFADFYEHLDKDFEVLKAEDEDFNKLQQLFAKDLISQNDDKVTVLSVLNLKEKNKSAVRNSLPQNDTIVIFDHKAFTDKIIEILKNDFNRLVALSLSLVFMILLLYYGRIELTLITFLPLLLSWLWTLGLMGLFDLKFTIFNIIISTFIFGLGIDYSIFIMQGLLQNYRYGKRDLPVFKTSVLLSAITTLTAIGVLIFAKHPAIQSIALLSIIGITSVVFAAYTLLPLLFNFLIKQQGKARSRPVTAKDLFFSLAVILTLFIGSVVSFFAELILRIIPVKNHKKKQFFHRWIQITLSAIRYVPLNIRCRVNNPFGEDFKKPAVIIANHQAHLDISLILMLHPKILILTNDWVQKNFFYGRIVRYADYLPTSNGREKNTELLKEKIKNGYSLLIFPEGTRSKEGEIQRFHKGAFYYAQEFNLEILPIILHGTGDCIPKGEPFLKSGRISVNIQKRIKPEAYGKELRRQAKNIRKLMQEQYHQIKEINETGRYYKHKLIGNYIYKGPVLEHYMRIKIKTENYYDFFHKACPEKGIITDIGCGYGFMSYMLNFLAPEREITGFDYDCNKIKTAENNISKNDRIRFICADINKTELPESDVFILADILHYMPKPEQRMLISRCINKLKPKGKIIIRDGNAEMIKKHKGTKLSEFFSTRLLRFNKAQYGKLFFSSESEIAEIAETHNMQYEITDETKHTSNLIYVLSKPKKTQL